MRSCLKLFVVLILAFANGLFAQQISRPPYLQNATENAITLKWRTDVPTDTRVRYGDQVGNLIHIATDTALVYNHTMRLFGLHPYTQYYYAVGHDSVDLVGDDPLYHFRTNPIPGTVQPIKIWALGDFGKNNPQEYWVRNSYTDYAAANRPADVWLWLGDNAYDTGADSQYTQKVFNIYDSVFANQCFWPTPGNHDYVSVNQNGLPPTHTGPYYSIVEVPTIGEAGGVPSGGEMMYSFDYGNVHLVSLNSELGSWIFGNNTPLTRWLIADLQATDKEWKIVYFHQPPHSKSSHNSDNFWETNMVAMRSNIMPIVEQFGVDLVLSGHSHAYERSKLLYGFYDWSFMYNASFEMDGGSGNESLGAAYRKSNTGPNPNHGTVYAVVGNGASSVSNPALNHPVMYYGWGCDTCVGSLIVDVIGDTMRAQYYASTGAVMDQFSIIKDNIAHISPAELPLVESLKIWPNPFSEQLELEFTLQFESRLTLRLMDILGHTIYQRKLGKLAIGVHQFSLNNLSNEIAAGTYIVQLTDGQRSISRRVIKTNP